MDEERRQESPAAEDAPGEERDREPNAEDAPNTESSPGEPGDRSRDPSPHSSLSNPARDADPTEWPDPYDKREDPRDPPDPDEQPFGREAHPHPGATSTSEPHPSQDPEAGDRWEGPKREKVDE